MSLKLRTRKRTKKLYFRGELDQMLKPQNSWPTRYPYKPPEQPLRPINPLKFKPLIHGRFSDPYFKWLWGGEGKLTFFSVFLIGASKKFCKVKNFQVWIKTFSVKQKNKGRGGMGMANQLEINSVQVMGSYPLHVYPATANTNTN